MSDLEMMERLKAHLLFNSELKKHNSESGRVAETYKSEMRENEQQIYQDFKEMFSELKENWAENEVKVKESSAGFSDSINVNELLDKQEEIDKRIVFHGVSMSAAGWLCQPDALSACPMLP